MKLRSICRNFQIWAPFVVNLPGNFINLGWNLSFQEFGKEINILLKIKSSPPPPLVKRYTNYLITFQAVESTPKSRISSLIFIYQFLPQISNTLFLQNIQILQILYSYHSDLLFPINRRNKYSKTIRVEQN